MTCNTACSHFALNGRARRGPTCLGSHPARTYHLLSPRALPVNRPMPSTRHQEIRTRTPANTQPHLLLSPVSALPILIQDNIPGPTTFPRRCPSALPPCRSTPLAPDVSPSPLIALSPLPSTTHRIPGTPAIPPPAPAQEMSKHSAAVSVDTPGASLWVRVDSNTPQPAQLLQLDYSPRVGGRCGLCTVGCGFTRGV